MATSTPIPDHAHTRGNSMNLKRLLDAVLVCALTIAAGQAAAQLSPAEARGSQEPRIQGALEPDAQPPPRVHAGRQGGANAQLGYARLHHRPGPARAEPIPEGRSDGRQVNRAAAETFGIKGE